MSLDRSSFGKIQQERETWEMGWSVSGPIGLKCQEPGFGLGLYQCLCFLSPFYCHLGWLANQMVRNISLASLLAGARDVLMVSSICLSRWNIWINWEKAAQPIRRHCFRSMLGGPNLFKPGWWRSPALCFSSLSWMDFVIGMAWCFKQSGCRPNGLLPAKALGSFLVLSESRQS